MHQTELDPAYMARVVEKAVEYSGVDEFLGAGYPPCAQVDQIMRYVRAGRNAHADRFVIRIDRICNSIFDSAQEINLSRRPSSS